MNDANANERAVPAAWNPGIGGVTSAADQLMFLQLSITALPVSLLTAHWLFLRLSADQGTLNVSDFYHVYPTPSKGPLKTWEAFVIFPTETVVSFMHTQHILILCYKFYR